MKVLVDEDPWSCAAEEEAVEVESWSRAGGLRIVRCDIYDGGKLLSFGRICRA